MYRTSIVIMMVLVTGTYAGCSTYHLTTPPDEKQALTIDAGGGNITGEVFITTKSGETRKAVDATVYLVPVTDYSRAWFDHYVVQGDKIDGKDPRSFGSVRAAAVDTEGRFQFRQVTAGRYYLTCTVQYQGSNFHIGGRNFGMRTLVRAEAYAEVEINPGKDTVVSVTRPSG
jgi:hypothetical protein